MLRHLMLGVFGLMLVTSTARAETLTFDCKFDHFISPEESNQSDFGFQVSVDTITGDAFITGNAGVAPLQMYSGPQGWTFIELVPSGAVMTTTLIADGTAVHSRNTIFPDGLGPSQYYGHCS